MAVSEKINALLQIRGMKKYELAELLEMSPQSLRNKFNRSSFSAEDLIKISGFLNCTLAFEIDEKQKIILDESDLREQKDNANAEK